MYKGDERSLPGPGSELMDRNVSVQLLRLRKEWAETAVRGLLDSIGGDRVIVIIDRDMVFGPSHLSSGFMHAARAIVRGKSRARDPSIEVLRWLSGSHQLVDGTKRASPGKGTEHILICSAPEGWPKEEDGLAMPTIVREELFNIELDGCETVPEWTQIPLWGGKRSSKLLPYDFQGTEKELEMAILEMVAFTDLQ